ncbi:hypothetical protein OFR22_07485 [Brachyspira hyodysenteriae]|nr:hypothetical protein [Brachyspira hyodysenteriae]MCZ9838223.1 hypothetical protein [Brachyspira hyodysenteriae]MCZ9849334.1 hypothetical protein [Brachyspira hyodysenteriae]MCZ9860872.1 hypothetical protein [Brachyspira hyodysenteriae]MCZ9870862.1 hypothetical protein [Brachyspira hyodysenteriae]MCZ9873778.1 hypothetical protein [Brachyspira hyodysenteriae]
MGPNIKYCYNEYWDFFDHHTPLSEKSVIEALEMNGFSIVKAVDRFLPFSTKSKLPKNTFLIWLYLKLPIFWKIFGKQFFIVAKKINYKGIKYENFNYRFSWIYIRIFS